MADSKKTSDPFMSFWQDSQDAFFNVQKDLAENFAKSVTETFRPKQVSMPSNGYEAWQSFVKTWAPQWEPASTMAMGVEHMLKNRNEAVFALFDPASWMSQSPEQLKTVLKNIASAPQFADMMMPQIGAAEVWQEQLDFQEATSAFAKIMHEAWLRSYTDYSKTFSVEDLISGNVKEAMDAWLKITNAELLDTQASQEFMDAQKNLMSASTRLNKRQAKMAEKWAAAYQMPTRTEIDDLTKTVTELRREIRTLKRELESK